MHFPNPAACKYVCKYIWIIAYLIVNIDVGHIVVSICNNTRNSRINVNHYSHGYKEWTHRWEYDISFILIVAALSQISSTGFIPNKNEMQNGLLKI